MHTQPNMKISAKHLNDRLKEKIHEVLDHFVSTKNPVRLVPGSVRRYSYDLASAVYEYPRGRRFLRAFLWQSRGKGTWYDFSPTYSMLAGFNFVNQDLLSVEQHNTEIDVT